MAVGAASLSSPLHADQLIPAEPIECWFAEITRKRIRRGTFRSVRDLGPRHPRLCPPLQPQPSAIPLGSRLQPYHLQGQTYRRI